jgi:autotransporter-associated beta strand protein
VPSGTGITSTVLNTNLNVLTLGQDGLTVSSTSNSGATFNGGGSILLTGSQNWANNSSLPLNVSTGISAASSGTTLTINGTGNGGVILGPITNGTGSISLVLNQTGTTTLSGTDNISGSLSVQSGTVVANGNDTFGSVAVSGGSLTLGGSNSIPGGVNITGGVVHLGSTVALGAVPTTLTFGSAGDLQLNGNNTAVNDLTGSSGAIVENASATAATFTDNLGTGNTDTWGGTLQDGTGGGPLSTVITGAGTLALTGSNTYTGSTTITGGATVQISGANNLSASPIILNHGTLESTGGTYNLASTQTVTLTANGTLQVDGGALTIPANISTGTNVLTISGGGNVNLPGNITGSGNASGLNITSSGIVTINGSNTYTGPTTVNNGSGLVQITGGTLGTLGTGNFTGPNIQLATSSSQSATMQISGGTVDADRVILGGNAGNTDGGNATLIQTGGTLNSSQWFSVGSGVGGGTSSATGVYNISGGTLNVNLAGGTNMEVGNFGGTTGTVYVSGTAAINIYNSGNINMLANSGAGGYIYQNGGTVTFYSNNGTTNGGSGSLVVGAAGTGNALYALNGGTLAVPSITHTGGTGTFRFNGGVLEALSSSANFVNNLNAANVEAGGAIINVPAGLTPTIPQALVHDGSGPSTDGGLTLQGAGTLALTSTSNSWTGPTTITGGTLLLKGSLTVNNLGSGGSAMNGALNTTAGTGTITTSGGPLAGTGALNLNGDGTTLDVNNPITSLGNTSNWTVSAWVHTTQSGFTILNKGSGNGWAGGNTTFYLGAGNGNAGAGTIPSAVRNSGGWMGGSGTSAADGAWDMVTYTDNGGVQTVYVNGVMENTVSALNAPDIGSVVRFGYDPNPGDGPVTSNGAMSAINIYNTALTQSQINSLLSSNQAGVTPVAAYDFSSGNVSAGVSNILPSGTPVSLTSNTAALDVEGVNQTIGSLSGSFSGSMVKLGLGSVLTVTNATSSEFDGTVNGSGGLTVTNSGTFKLGGTTNYSGATVVSNGATLDLSVGSHITGSLSVDSASSLNLGLGNVLAVTGSASLAGTLNLFGTVGTLPETLMTYSSETGTFTPGTGIPAGDTLVYNTNALLLESTATGPATLTWNNAGGAAPSDGLTWDIANNNNWNNGSGTVAYSDSSNGSTGDIVNFTDVNNTNYTVSISGVVHPTSVTFANTTGNYVVGGVNSSSGIAGPASLTLSGSGTVTLSSNNSYTGGTFVNAGKLIVAGANAFPSNGSVGTPLTVAGSAVFQIANHSGSSSYVPTLSSLSNSGTIDITNNAMVIKNANASIGTLFGEVANGYHNGGWNGTNSSAGVILSSTAAADTRHLTAVGIATGLTSFQGAGGSVSVNPADVVLKYTYYGDANLDGQVNSADYTLTDAGFLSQGGAHPLTGWQNGDFNYDGVINGSDYTLIDNAFNMQGAQILAQVASPTAQIAGTGTSSAVPEPASLGLLGIGAIGLLGRRNRRHR